MERSFTMELPGRTISGSQRPSSERLIRFSVGVVETILTVVLPSAFAAYLATPSLAGWGRAESILSNVSTWGGGPLSMVAFGISWYVEYMLVIIVGWPYAMGGGKDQIVTSFVPNVVTWSTYSIVLVFQWRLIKRLIISKFVRA